MTSSGAKDDDEELHGRAEQDVHAERKLFLDWRIPLGPSRRPSIPRVVDLSDPPLISSRPVSRDGMVTFHFRHAYVAKVPARPARGVAVRDQEGCEIALHRILPERKLARFKDLPRGRARTRGLADCVVAKRLRGEKRRRVVRAVQKLAAKAKTWQGFRQAIAAAGYSLVRGSGVMGRAAKRPGSAAAHQAYIERAGRYGSGAGGVEVDDDGRPSSFGTIGVSLEERQRFWGEVERIERDGGRVQSRLVIELPYEVDAKTRGAIIDEFARVFDERGLLWHAAIHVPDPQGDRRNYHCHMVYHDRPAERAGPCNWHFQPTKDRASQGKTWILSLRRRYAVIANHKLAEVGAEKRYDPRRYREMGIKKPPGVHLGPNASALERLGILTAAGRSIIDVEQAFEKYSTLKRSVGRLESVLTRAEAILGWPEGISREADKIRRRAGEVAKAWLELEFTEEENYLAAEARRREERDRDGRAQRREDWLYVRRTGQRPLPRRPPSVAKSDSFRVDRSRRLRELRRSISILEERWNAERLLAERVTVQARIEMLEKRLSQTVTPGEWQKEKERLEKERIQSAIDERITRDRLKEMIRRHTHDSVAVAQILIDNAERGGAWRRRAVAELAFDRNILGLLSSRGDEIAEAAEWAAAMRNKVHRSTIELNRRLAIEQRGELENFVLEDSERRIAQHELERYRAKLAEVDVMIRARPAAFRLAKERGVILTETTLVPTQRGGAPVRSGTTAASYGNDNESTQIRPFVTGNDTGPRGRQPKTQQER